MRHVGLTVRMWGIEGNGEVGVDRRPTKSIASWAGRILHSAEKEKATARDLRPPLTTTCCKAVRRLSERAEPARALAVGQAAGVHPLAEVS